MDEDLKNTQVAVCVIALGFLNIDEIVLGKRITLTEEEICLRNICIHIIHNEVIQKENELIESLKEIGNISFPSKKESSDFNEQTKFIAKILKSFALYESKHSEISKIKTNLSEDFHALGIIACVNAILIEKKPETLGIKGCKIILDFRKFILGVNEKFIQYRT